MKASRLLIITGSLAALSAGLYVAKFSHMDNTALSSNNALFSADTPKASSQANDYGGGFAPPLTALKEEVALLKVELATLKVASRESGRLQKELFKLKQEVVALQRRVGNFSAADETPANTENAAASSETMEFTEQDIIAAAEEEGYQHRKQMEIIDSVFWSENVDSQWSTKASDLIAQHLENEEQIKTSLANVDCRATLCRVEASHQDADAAEAFELQFPMRVGKMLPQISYLYEEQNDGSVSMVMYLARNGYDLPQAIQ